MFSLSRGGLMNPIYSVFLFSLPLKLEPTFIQGQKEFREINSHCSLFSWPVKFVWYVVDLIYLVFREHPLMTSHVLCPFLTYPAWTYLPTYLVLLYNVRFWELSWTPLPTLIQDVINGRRYPTEKFNVKIECKLGSVNTCNKITVCNRV